ncbi:LysE family translocator [Rubrivivax sp. RP6-9]|uniref:LysE family translocator n=1 Tax=Rubrivivax sp. RP6-9 TaxID=3415750 RepID=UPI003CC67076
MPGAEQLLLFAGAVLVLNATPGVDLLLTVSRTLAGGARAGMAAALGINAGCVLHALAAAFGLAALLALHPQAFLALQWAGAAYLAWLGLGLLRQAWRPAAAAEATAATDAPPGTVLAPPAWAEFRTGLVTNVLNPKVALFFLAFLPQFVPAASPHKTVSFLLLGAWFVLQSTIFLFGLVLMAARLARWQTSIRARRWGAGIGGLLFIALALRLAAAKPAVA